MQKTDYQIVKYLGNLDLTQREEIIVLYLSAAINSTAPISATIYKEFQGIYKKYQKKNKKNKPQ